MIISPPGWRLEPRHEAVLVLPPGGASRGGVRYRDRLRPLRPVVDLAREHLEQPGFAVESRTDFERFVTEEGEHACRVAAIGTQGSRRIQRDVAIILLDDAYARLSCLSSNESDFTEFRRVLHSLALGDRHFLGVRRRWFEYTPPGSWRSRPRGFTTEWSPPTFPRERALLVVWPALPRADVSLDDALSGLLGAQGSDVDTRDHAPLASMTAASGLSGHEWHVVRATVDGPATHTHAVVLVDELYVYPMRLELSEEAQRTHGQLLHQIARTIVPVPRRAQRAHVPEGIWAE